MLDFGFLNINKPRGISSFAVIYELRKITSIQKIGHTGTLDPFATGVLLIGIGKATRFISLFSNDYKSYTAVTQLGIKTNSGDITGTVIEDVPLLEITSTEVAEIKNKVLNLTEQIPPDYSAIKINGKRAYELARKKKQFDIPSRSIHIKSFEINDFRLPYLTYSCTVSKGTYIRTLSETIGEMLGTIATTVELKRTKVGDIDLVNSVDLDMLDSNNWKQYLLPIEVVLKNMVSIRLNQAEERMFTTGIVINERREDDGLYLVYAETELKGLGEISKGVLFPRRVII
jgi:tRNA pseudouridine55 synthase